MAGGQITISTPHKRESDESGTDKEMKEEEEEIKKEEEMKANEEENV